MPRCRGYLWHCPAQREVGCDRNQPLRHKDLPVGITRSLRDKDLGVTSHLSDKDLGFTSHLSDEDLSDKDLGVA